MLGIHSFATYFFSGSRVVFQTLPRSNQIANVAHRALHTIISSSTLLSRSTQHRSFSTNNLDPEKKAIQEHNGELWSCIGRKKDPTGKGFLYDFFLKPEYRNSRDRTTRDKVNNIYPAIEFYGEYAYHLFSPYMPAPTTDYFNALGYAIDYSDNSLLMTLPDLDALFALYNKVGVDDPGLRLPNLKIFSSQGIAKDLDFVRALIQHHAVLSEGKEFVHDHTAHIIPLLTRIFRDNSNFHSFVMDSTEFYKMYLYKIERLKAELSNEKSDFFTEEQIQFLRAHLPIIKALLGALVDAVSSHTEFEPGELLDVIHTYEWQRYLKNRFSLAKHVASPHPKPPVFDARSCTEIENLLPLIESLPTNHSV
jgi:hypothetical protein